MAFNTEPTRADHHCCSCAYCSRNESFAVAAVSFTAPKLSLGRHRFQVRARDNEGKVDPTPASFRFRVVGG